MLALNRLTLSLSLSLSRVPIQSGVCVASPLESESRNYQQNASSPNLIPSLLIIQVPMLRGEVRKVGEECGCPNERKGKCVGERREEGKKRGIGVTRKGRKEGRMEEE